MKQRIDSLKKYLKDTVKLPTEMTRVYVESGLATAKFHDIEMYEMQGGQSDPVVFNPADTETKFHGRNEYQLSLHIRNYGGDVDKLINLMLYWMHSEHQKIALPYVLEDNNDQTVDLWLDMVITEDSRNKGEEVHTC